MTLSIQFLTMMAMVLSGFYLGIALQTHRRLYVYWRHRIFLTYVLEISFWIIQTLLIFYFLYQVNDGEIGLYVFLAGLLGFAMYQVFAARLYKKCLEHIIAVLRVVFRFCTSVVNLLFVQPIKWIFIILFMCLGWIGKIILYLFLFILKLIFAPINWIFSFIWRIIPSKIKIKITNWAGFFSKIKNRSVDWLKNIWSKRR